MIDHSQCDHPSTRADRARCRRKQAGGDSTPRATPKTIDFARGSAGPTAFTPRDRDKQCDVCGVERVVIFGTDPLSSRVLYVGEKCSYYLRQSLDAAPVAW